MGQQESTINNERSGKQQPRTASQANKIRNPLQLTKQHSNSLKDNREHNQMLKQIQNSPIDQKTTQNSEHSNFNITKKGEWNDNESYTCGWLLSEFIRKSTNDQNKDLQTLALKSQDGQYATLDYYLTQVEKPLTSISNKEEFEAVSDSLINIKKNAKLNSKGEIPAVLESFTIEKCIGKGGFSKVMQVRHKATGQIYAMKVLRKDKIKQDNKVEQIMTERRILEKINHPFLIKMHWAFQSQHYLHLVLDFCPGGELFYLLSRYRRFPEPIAKFYFAEIVLGIEYLHNNNIMYRDLKPENILIDLDGHIRITDFGLSKDNFSSRARAISFCGSPEYMSPEMLSQEFHTRMVDFYSLGALLYEMLTGLPPLYSNDRDEMYSNIVYKVVTYPEFLSQEAIDLLQGLLCKDPKQRLGYKRGLEDVKQHEFCKNIDWDQIMKRAPEAVPIKVNLRSQNFDPEYTKLEPRLSLNEGSNEFEDFSQQIQELQYQGVQMINVNLEGRINSCQKQKTHKHSKSLDIAKDQHKSNHPFFENSPKNIFLDLYSPSMIQLSSKQITKVNQLAKVDVSDSPTFKDFQFQKEDSIVKHKKVNQLKKKQSKKKIIKSDVMNYSIRKDIQGTGKAPFPGEKNITDNSPRMEEVEDLDDMSFDDKGDDTFSSKDATSSQDRSNIQDEHSLADHSINVTANGQSQQNTLEIHVNHNIQVIDEQTTLFTHTTKKGQKMNRCSSLTPTKTMTKNYDEKMKNMYQKFAYTKEKLNSATPQAFLVNINTQNRKGEEKRLGSPQIISPVSSASSNYRMNFDQKFGNKKPSQYLITQSKPISNTQLKIKYNEVIGNVISERKRMVPQTTVISQKVGRTPSTQKGTVQTPITTSTTHYGNQSVSKSQKRSTFAQQKQNSQQKVVHEFQLGDPNNHCFGDYLINLTGLNPLEQISITSPDSKHMDIIDEYNNKIQFTKDIKQARKQSSNSSLCKGKGGQILFSQASQDKVERDASNNGSNNSRQSQNQNNQLIKNNKQPMPIDQNFYKQIETKRQQIYTKIDQNRNIVPNKHSSKPPMNKAQSRVRKQECHVSPSIICKRNGINAMLSSDNMIPSQTARTNQQSPNKFNILTINSSERKHRASQFTQSSVEKKYKNTESSSVTNSIQRNKRSIYQRSTDGSRSKARRYGAIGVQEINQIEDVHESATFEDAASNAEYVKKLINDRMKEIQSKILQNGQPNLGDRFHSPKMDISRFVQIKYKCKSRDPIRDQHVVDKGNSLMMLEKTSSYNILNDVLKQSQLNKQRANQKLNSFSEKVNLK